ncbi:MAG: cysteine hydrolase [Acidobacteria bacterium]|nr:cysteine hydrolase [Acidobacteriota bacterium]
MNEQPKRALIVIDVQQLFFMDANRPVHNSAALVANLNKLIAKFRENGEPVIFVRHHEPDEGGLNFGSARWQVYSGLDARADDVYVEKTHADSFYRTNLAEVLAGLGVDSVVLAGLQTDYCVDSTCRSAFGRGLRTTLVSDAHSTYDNSFMTAEQTIAYHTKLIGGRFAELRTTGDLTGEV